MKFLLLFSSFLVSVLGFQPDAYAQDVREYEDYSITVVISTAQANKTGIGMGLRVDLDLPDTLSYTSMQIRPVVYLAYEDQGRQHILAKAPATATPMGFEVLFEIDKKAMLSDLLNPRHELFFVSSSNAEFNITDGGNVTETYRYSISSVSLKNKSLREGIALSNDQYEVVLDALGGYQRMYYNNFDAGWKQASGSDSAGNNAYLELTYVRNLYKSVSVGLGGMLSTDAADEFGHIELMPFNLSSKDRIWNASGLYQTDLDGESRRFMARASYRRIVDNFIDLTQGYNRLRVKPFIQGGLGAAYYTHSPDSTLEGEIIFEPFIQLLYDIPLLDNYIIKLDLYAYTRSDSELVFDLKNDTKWQASVDLGYGIGKNTKIVGKYAYGTSQITNETDQQLMLGLLIDMLNN